MTAPPFVLPEALLEQPLVSVIVPAYNHARYVIEALDSVRAQTLQAWELIVVDDGSTDDTWALIQDWARTHADSRVRLVHQPNAGSHAAINRGMSMARAPYLAILNSDDRYRADRLQYLYERAERGPCPDALLVSRLRLIDQTGAPVAADHWWNRMYADLLERLEHAAPHTPNTALWALFWGNFTVTTSNFFMSRRLWDRVGPLRRRRYVLDWDFALRVAREYPHGQVVLVDEPLLDYRLHGQNTILSGALRNHAEAYQTLRMHLKYCLSRGIAVPLHALDRIHLLERFLRQTQATKAVGELKIQYAQAEHDRAIALRDLEAVSCERDGLRARVAAMERSTSWRLTRPLRWLKQRFT